MAQSVAAMASVEVSSGTITSSAAPATIPPTIGVTALRSVTMDEAPYLQPRLTFVSPLSRKIQLASLGPWVG